MPPTPSPPPRRGVSRSDRGRSQPAELWRELRRLLLLLVVVIALVAAFLQATIVFMLGFAAVLIALLLHDLSTLLATRTPLSQGWALLVVSLGFLGAVVTLGWFATPPVLDQARQFAERLPQAIDALDLWLITWLGAEPGFSVRDALPEVEAIIGTLPLILTTTFGVLGSLVVLLVLGIYLAMHPTTYRDGLVRLFAVGRRQAARDTVDELGNLLRRWLRGQMVAMVAVGTLSYLGLTMLGVPLALGLALLTGLLEFVPYLGPIIAAVPVILVALTESWELALYALLVYVVIQMFEGYVLVPLIQQRAVFIPPALILFSQVLLGVLFGIVGIVLATPLTAVVVLLVRRAYVEALLER
ncbi:MAG: AI-2E family transporter [Pseudomonadales bacterium]